MDIAQTPILKLSAPRYNAAVFSFALILRLAFMVMFLAKGMDVAYGRDLYYNLALSWLGWLPMPAFDATHRFIPPQSPRCSECFGRRARFPSSCFSAGSAPFARR